MKNIIRFCLLLVGIAFYSCDDPYEDTTYKVYELQPAASYLQNHPDQFSEWVKIMKSCDLFNAVNRADEAFTVLAPTNEAVESFYKKQSVSSVEELIGKKGEEYVRILVQYHIMNDSIDKEDFIQGGELPTRTLSGDALQVTFDEDSSTEEGVAVYVNSEARVDQYAIRVVNGRVYTLEGVLSPAVETIYERLSVSGNYKIFCEALEKTGWRDTLNITTSVLYGPLGMEVETRRFFTVLAVSDEVFKQAGITSFNALSDKVEAIADDYENADNLLNVYMAYHIMDGSYKVEAFSFYDKLASEQKIWHTRAGGGHMVLASPSGLNDEGVQLDVEDSDIWVRNGFIHSINGYLPTHTQEEAIPFVFDFCNYPTLNSYIIAKGKGQYYQQLSREDDGQRTALTKYIRRQKIVPQVACYQLEVGPTGTRSSEWDYIEYETIGSKGGPWQDELNRDHLVINIGTNGTLSMEIPPIVAGKYKVTLYFAYDASQAFMGDSYNGTDRGLTQFTFDDGQGSLKRVYDTRKAAENGYFSIELYGTDKPLVFDSTESHTLKMVVTDAGASTKDKFRMYFDYLLFEPITE